MEIPNEASFLFSRGKDVREKIAAVVRKHIPSCNLLIKTIIEKMESNRSLLLKKFFHKVVSCVNC